MIRAKVLGRKYSKRLSKPDLKATFSDVCLVKTELKSNDLRIQVLILEKPHIVYMCIVEIHEMNITSINKIKQGQNQSKRRPTTSDKTCWDTLQKYLFLHLTWQKCFQSQIKRPFLPSPIAMLFTGHTWAVKPKQHCTRGGEGGEFVPFGQDGCMERNWKLHWNASTVLSCVVDFFCGGSEKSRFQLLHWQRTASKFSWTLPTRKNLLFL